MQEDELKKDKNPEMDEDFSTWETIEKKPQDKTEQNTEVEFEEEEEFFEEEIISDGGGVKVEVSEKKEENKTEVAIATEEKHSEAEEMDEDFSMWESLDEKTSSPKKEEKVFTLSEETKKELENKQSVPKEITSQKASAIKEKPTAVPVKEPIIKKAPPEEPVVKTPVIKEPVAITPVVNVSVAKESPVKEPVAKDPVTPTVSQTNKSSVSEQKIVETLEKPQKTETDTKKESVSLPETEPEPKIPPKLSKRKILKMKSSEELQEKLPQNEEDEVQEVVKEEDRSEFSWPGNKGVYFFYIWHCAEKDETKKDWVAGRFPFLASKMPLPSNEKLGDTFRGKDWAFRRIQSKKDIPLYYYYSEVFQPSFYDPQKITYLKPLYFAYYPAYFREVMVPVDGKAKEIRGPLLDYTQLSYVPFLDEFDVIKHHKDWIKEKLNELEKNPIAGKSKTENIKGAVILQQILRFYLRTYSFLLWCLNNFCNYDNHARLGFSSVGKEIFSNCFPIGFDIEKYLGVRTQLQVTSNTHTIGNFNYKTDDIEIIPTFFGLGSFTGNAHFEACDHKKDDFIVIDNCPQQEKTRAEKTKENFTLFHNLFNKHLFSEVNEILAKHDITVNIRRFTDKNVPLSVHDETLEDSIELAGTNLYERTIKIDIMEKKSLYLKNFLSHEDASALYKTFNQELSKNTKNNIFHQESAEDWILAGYLTYGGKLSSGNIHSKTFIDFFSPDAVPESDPREKVPRGILPFVIGCE